MELNCCSSRALKMLISPALVEQVLEQRGVDPRELAMLAPRRLPAPRWRRCARARPATASTPAMQRLSRPGRPSATVNGASTSAARRRGSKLVPVPAPQPLRPRRTASTTGAPLFDAAQAFDRLVGAWIRDRLVDPTRLRRLGRPSQRLRRRSFRPCVRAATT
jgi:hypothetical protein